MISRRRERRKPVTGCGGYVQEWGNDKNELDKGN